MVTQSGKPKQTLWFIWKLLLPECFVTEETKTGGHFGHQVYGHGLTVTPNKASADSI